MPLLLHLSATWVADAQRRNMSRSWDRLHIVLMKYMSNRIIVQIRRHIRRIGLYMNIIIREETHEGQIGQVSFQSDIWVAFDSYEDDICVADMTAYIRETQIGQMSSKDR